MKQYEKPLVEIICNKAEGVYAASGDCWTISHAVTNEWSGNGKIFGFTCEHLDGLEHISASTTVTVTFNYPIATVNCQEYETSISGNTVTFTRVRLGDAYQSGDNYTVNMEVYTGAEDTTRALSITDVSIACEKTLNVQGGGASEIGQ